MRALANRLRAFLLNEEAPTAVEYALVLALILMAVLLAITLLGEKVSTVFQHAESVLPNGT